MLLRQLQIQLTAIYFSKYFQTYKARYIAIWVNVSLKMQFAVVVSFHISQISPEFSASVQVLPYFRLPVFQWWKVGITRLYWKSFLIVQLITTWPVECSFGIWNISWKYASPFDRWSSFHRWGTHAYTEDHPRGEPEFIPFTFLELVFLQSAKVRLTFRLRTATWESPPPPSGTHPPVLSSRIITYPATNQASNPHHQPPSTTNQSSTIFQNESPCSPSHLCAHPHQVAPAVTEQSFSFLQSRSDEYISSAEHCTVECVQCRQRGQ